MQRKLLKSQTNSNPLQSPPEPPLLEKQEVVIGKVVRNKRKCITTVKGLERFGVRLSDASKKHGKKFATGASVVKVYFTRPFATSSENMWCLVMFFLNVWY
uniref:Putative translation machinery-associated protein 22 n=1 Tax=Davidia involucrata TaxID=16924 RepID=A0A5B6YSY7_DAVIN